jgi:GTP-binding protein
VAVVGRPNVGKSSLVNRILGRREAIVDALPGVTRDRHSSVAEWAGRRFVLVDTGGLEVAPRGLERIVTEQARAALGAADVIVLVVDGTVGPLEDDLRVAAALRRQTKPVLVAVNKVDEPEAEAAAVAPFYGLGLGEPVALSALHGRGSGDLLETLVALLPGEDLAREAPWASLAILGRPNVGKSSILNALVGEARAIIAPSPGTTRDPVDARLTLEDGRSLELVDTAGLRRQVKIHDPIEYFSSLRARRTLHRVDAALLVVDAPEGVTGMDQRLAEEIATAGRACVVVLNKWDAAPADEQDRRRLESAIEDRIGWLAWAPRVRTSALTRRGLGRLLPAVQGAIESHRARLPTAEVNRIVAAAQAHRPHPRARAGARRVLYAVQADVAPPTFVLFTNGRLEEGYVRYLERRIREEHPFAGSPLRLRVKQRDRRPAPR